ncbi:hypothetical protein [Bacillus phage phiAGATE]|uniref:Uncharacterized protein n=1 Tax=Bacillus phage phiAGATE TaxID=1204533 RepID=L0LAD7_9CAUD|nr:hypothetical protein G380_gp032 [Bacillus phage phiAGATE]AGB62682.1 hypothetical protein [Bacillus phage phiAGATE]
MSTQTVIFGGFLASFMMFILFGPIVGIPVAVVYFYSIYSKMNEGRQDQYQQYEEYIAELEEENRRLKERQKFFE